MNSPFLPSPLRIALLIDAENVSAAWLPTVLAELARHGTPGIRRAYGDWTSANLAGWKGALHEHAIRPVQQFAYSKGKNATDMALVIEAMELLYTQDLDAFGIVSSDADFTPLVMHLKATGRSVYGFGERKTPPAFVNACTGFLVLEPALSEPAVVAPPEPVEGTRHIACDTKLVKALRAAVAASARDDGWALVSAAGSVAKRAASVDPRNYDAKTFTELFRKTGLFEVLHRPGEQPVVADKRSRDPACAPVLNPGSA